MGLVLFFPWDFHFSLKIIFFLYDFNYPDGFNYVKQFLKQVFSAQALALIHVPTIHNDTFTFSLSLASLRCCMKSTDLLNFKR